MSTIGLIGVDVGTQGTKAALYAENGTLLAEAFEASRLLHPAPDAVEQDPDDLYASVVHTIRQLMEQAGEAVTVAGVAIDAQMAGILGIGREGEAVTPYDSWLDTRCQAQTERMKRLAGEEIVAQTGGQVIGAHGPKVLWWQQERPEAYAAVAKFVTPSAYLTGRLCGLGAAEAYVDDTHLHFSGFADNRNRCWHTGLLDTFGVSAEKMPSICTPTQVVGTLTSEAARLCGLPGGTPVVAGCGDSAASSLGAGITRSGQIFDVAGTASIFSVSLSAFSPDVTHRTMLCARSAVPGLWLSLAYISGGGLCLRWFRDLQANSYAELDALAAQREAGCHGLLFIPHFAGRTCPQDDAVKGSFLGLEWQHDAGTLYRAVMESIAYEYALYLDIVRQTAETPVTRVLGVGGGSRSRVFNQIKADVLGVPYTPLCGGDTATFGSAVLAGLGTGVYHDVHAAVAHNHEEGETQQPSPAHREVYRVGAEQYRRALESLGAFYTALLSK